MNGWIITCCIWVSAVCCTSSFTKFGIVYVCPERDKNQFQQKINVDWCMHCPVCGGPWMCHKSQEGRNSRSLCPTLILHHQPVTVLGHCLLWRMFWMWSLPTSVVLFFNLLCRSPVICQSEVGSLFCCWWPCADHRDCVCPQCNVNNVPSLRLHKGTSGCLTEALVSL